MQSLFEQNERKKEDNRQLIDLLATPQVKIIKLKGKGRPLSFSIGHSCGEVDTQSDGDDRTLEFGQRSAGCGVDDS